MDPPWLSAAKRTASVLSTSTDDPPQKKVSLKNRRKRSLKQQQLKPQKKLHLGDSSSSRETMSSEEEEDLAPQLQNVRISNARSKTLSSKNPASDGNTTSMPRDNLEDSATIESMARAFGVDIESEHFKNMKRPGPPMLSTPRTFHIDPPPNVAPASLGISSSNQPDTQGPAESPHQQLPWSITESRGDIFSKADCNTILVHAVNCHGCWGHGIAVQFRKLFPAAYAEYRAICKSGRAYRGRADILGPYKHRVYENVYVGCLYTSEGYGRKRDPPRMINETTVPAMQQLVHCFNEHNRIPEKANIDKILMPRINSKAFGVPWTDTKAVLTTFGFREPETLSSHDTNWVGQVNAIQVVDLSVEKKTK